MAKELSSLPAKAASTALMEMYPIVIVSRVNNVQGNKSCLGFFVFFTTFNIINKGHSSVPFEIDL